MNNETRWMLLIAYCLTLVVTSMSCVSLRSQDSDKDNSLDCVRNKQQWHEPHGISPGWCGK